METTAVDNAAGHASDASAGSMLRSTAPRILRDGVGPTVAFYAGWKLAGLAVGIAAGTLFAVGALISERRRGRPGLIAMLVLGFVLIQAGVGLIARSATVYLAQPVIAAGAQGVMWFVSVAVGRPLAGLFAREVFDFPEEVRASGTFRRVFGRVSLVWGAYFMLSGALQLVVLLLVGIDAYVPLHIASAAGIVALLGWSIRSALRGFRNSDEWGPAIAAAAEAGDGLAFTPTR